MLKKLGGGISIPVVHMACIRVGRTLCPLSDTVFSEPSRSVHLQARLRQHQVQQRNGSGI